MGQFLDFQLTKLYYIDFELCVDTEIIAEALNLLKDESK